MLVVLHKAHPSPAQLKAGNYPKRKVAWHGLTISIENERGSVRRGTDCNGKSWSVTMRHPYGYIKGSLGVDGDQVDCYLGPKLKTAPMVYVVHQRKVGDWERFDEDKCMLGFLEEATAKRAFLVHYDDPRFLGPITAIPVAEFVAKVKATTTQPRMLKARLLVVFQKAQRYRDQPGYRLERKRWHAIMQAGVALSGGGGGRDRAFRMTLPSSEGLATQEEAKAYWLQHYGGKDMPLTVQSGGKEYPIVVRFDAWNNHAYTDSRNQVGQKLPKRLFSQKRAQAMSRILDVIAHPHRRLRYNGADLLLEGKQNGEHYTVVLNWHDASGKYLFKSAYFRSISEIIRLQQRQDHRKKNGPLQKSEP